MSTLVENIQKVKNAHAALKDAISAKGIAVPESTKLTDMPALIEQIPSGGASEPTNKRAVFAYETETNIVVPNVMVVDMMAMINLGYCFYKCSNLTTLTLPDGFGQNATIISYCFYYCVRLTTLTLPDGFGQRSIQIGECFYNCSNLTTLTLPDGFGQNAININECFWNCSNLTTLTLPDGFGQKATSIKYCFSNCSNLTTLTLPDGFGQKATTLTNCFSRCSNLTTITGNPNFKVSLKLSECTNLTHDSIMVVINGLQTVTSTQTLTLGSTNLSKITNEEKKIATDKGWTLA